ncbi:MAG: hypothetical protein VB062_04785 [Christensenella sp.]|nr:hypothetical protein [Christensenella sp.]
MSEYLPKDDVWVTQIKLPPRVRAFCKRKGFDDCAVVNEDLNDEVKKEAVEHEIRHFRRGDIDSEDPVSALEKIEYNGRPT